MKKNHIFTSFKKQGHFIWCLICICAMCSHAKGPMLASRFAMQKITYLRINKRIQICVICLLTRLTLHFKWHSNMYLMIFFSRQIMSLFYGRKDSTWQILCSKERNELERLREKRFFDQLCKDGKLKVGGVAVFREKGRNPHPFSHCCFRSLFFSVAHFPFFS